MSIVFPDCNISAPGGAAGAGGAVGLLLPASASFKAANVGMVVGIWARSPAAGFWQNVNYNLLSRGTGAGGGADAYIRYLNGSATTVEARFRNGGVDLLVNTALTVLVGKTYLFMIIANAANTHFVACEPGGTPIVATVASGALYAANLAASDCWGAIGAGTATTSKSLAGPIDSAFMLTGLFPESAGVPNTALIQAIANGTQSLATLDAQLTSGVKKWNYSLRTAQTLTDDYVIAAALTTNNVTIDKVLMSGGPLRPVVLMPDVVLSSVSQVVFATAGVAASATCSIIAEGGAYSGSAPFAVQARLVKEDGSALVNWITVDAAPAAGRWAQYTFTSVPMTAGNLNLEFRAVDSGLLQVGNVSASHGKKGAGFHVIQCSQSQGIIYYVDAVNGLAVPATLRARITLPITNAPSLVFQTLKLDPAQPTTLVGRGIRQACIELDTLFPRVPIHFATLGKVGEPIEAFNPGGAFVSHWAGMKSFMGVVQPYVFMPLGHSASADANYQTYLNTYIAQAVANLGTPLKIIHAPVPRYAQAGIGASYTQVQFSREGVRARVAANLSTDWIGGNWQPMKNDASDNGPHPFNGDVGVGRGGAYQSWALMQWCRAVEDTPLVIKATRASSTRVDLSFKAAN